MMETPAKTCIKPPNIFEQGIAWFLSHVDDTLSENKDSVLYLTKLRDQYRQWLSNHDVENAMTYRSSHLKQRVKNYYDSPQGCQIMIFHRKGASGIECFKDLRIGLLLAEVTKQKQVLVESDDEDRDENQDSQGNSVLMSYFIPHFQKISQAEL